jgi:cell division protein FtsQ
MPRRDHLKANRKVRRISKKKAGRVRGWTGRIGKGILSLAMLASLTVLGFTLYQYAQRSESLNVGEIKILGCAQVKEKELLDLAGIDFSASLLNLDLQQVSSRLAQHPWVEKAKVKRDWARKALIIEVQERTAQALVLLDDLYLVDRHGEVFKKAEARERMDLPVLTGLRREDVLKREKEAISLIGQALEVLEILGQKKALAPREISEINLNRQNGLTLFTLNGGIPIRLGSGDFSEKVSRLEKVLPDIRAKAERVEYLDLNYPRKVVVKMKETGQERARKS